MTWSKNKTLSHFSDSLLVNQSFVVGFLCLCSFRTAFCRISFSDASGVQVKSSRASIPLPWNESAPAQLNKMAEFPRQCVIQLRRRTLISVVLQEATYQKVGGLWHVWFTVIVAVLAACRSHRTSSSLCLH